MKRLRIGSRATVYRWRLAGMPCLRGPGVKSRILYSWADVQEWMEGHGAVKPEEKEPVEHTGELAWLNKIPGDRKGSAQDA